MLDCVLRQQFNSAFGRTQIGVPEHLLLLTCPPALRNHRKKKAKNNMGFTNLFCIKDKM